MSQGENDKDGGLSATSPQLGDAWRRMLRDPKLIEIFDKKQRIFDEILRTISEMQAKIKEQADQQRARAITPRVQKKKSRRGASKRK